MWGQEHRSACCFLFDKGNLQLCLALAVKCRDQPKFFTSLLIKERLNLQRCSCFPAKQNLDHRANSNKFQYFVLTTQTEYVVCCVADVGPEAVANYLHQHPDFLELYVLNNVEEGDLERWSRRKATHRDEQDARLNGEKHSQLL